MATLPLGPQPGRLDLSIIEGEVWRAELTLEENDVPIAWAAAPVIKFADGTSWTAVLSASVNPVVADAVATWDKTVPEVALVIAQPSARLTVSGVTWWAGPVIRRG